MNLTKFSDYSLRVLLYLALHPDRTVPVAEISKAYGVSAHHLVKVAHLLVDECLVTSVRGRHGGLRLKKAPADIKIGAVVRITETWHLVECFDSKTNTCPIGSVCGLKDALRDAQRAFLDTLDERTLADFLPRRPSLLRVLKTPPGRERAG